MTPAAWSQSDMRAEGGDAAKREDRDRFGETRNEGVRAGVDPLEEPGVKSASWQGKKTDDGDAVTVIAVSAPSDHDHHLRTPAHPPGFHRHPIPTPARLTSQTAVSPPAPPPTASDTTELACYIRTSLPLLASQDWLSVPFPPDLESKYTALFASSGSFSSDTRVKHDFAALTVKSAWDKGYCDLPAEEKFITLRRVSGTPPPHHRLGRRRRALPPHHLDDDL
ncbi:hypothetical protein K438DRAFT_1988800 [Mycena galopus ATCC 62051]|nr:hypothetical protein K438DRAFT_1988800 [Mycena galopus ATCC 62051]